MSGSLLDSARVLGSTRRRMAEDSSSFESFRAEEERVIAQSAAFKKELGLRDLVLTQIVFVVGTSWVGTAAKLGSAQTVYWLLAIVLKVVARISNGRPPA